MITYAVAKHWLLNNLIAVALCIGGIESISIGSTKRQLYSSLTFLSTTSRGSLAPTSWSRWPRVSTGRSSCYLGGPSTTRKKPPDARSGRRRRPGPLPRVVIALRRDPAKAPRRPFFRSTLLAYSLRARADAVRDVHLRRGATGSPISRAGLPRGGGPGRCAGASSRSSRRTRRRRSRCRTVRRRRGSLVRSRRSVAASPKRAASPSGRRPRSSRRSTRRSRRAGCGRLRITP